MSHAADRIEETVASLARILEPATTRNLAHLGAGVALHDVAMRLITQFGGQRSVKTSKVLAVVHGVQRELDEAKAAREGAKPCPD